MADFPPSQVFWWIFRYNKTMNKFNIGKNIKTLRTNNKLSQKKFGEILGYSARTISDWECSNTEPDLTTIKKIVKYFDISYEELFDD